jgi:hypothetical protein
MGQEKPGFWKLLAHRMIQKGRNVLLIVREPRHMPGVGVLEWPIGKPLTTPVHRQGRIAPRGQFTGCGAIFLDVFGPAREQEHSALLSLPPQRGTDAYAISSL